MGPLIPIALAIAAWSCSSKYGVDEDPIVADSGSHPDSTDASVYSDTPHVDLPNATDGYSPDVITADLFATDAGDVYGPDVVVTPDVFTEPDVPTDTQTDVIVTPKYCEPKVTLPTSCGVTEIAAGGNVSCLIKSGTVYCAGKIVSSDNPNTALFSSTTFASIPSFAGATHIAAGGNHICAIMPGNTVKCLGQNFWGQLGDGTQKDATVAVPISNFGGIDAIALGGFHSAGIASGKVYTWGLNSGGQLGLAAMPLTSTTPTAVPFPAGTSVTSIAAGTLHSIAILSDGTTYAYGNNSLFPLGVGATGKVLTPMLMQNSTQELRAAAGDDFTLLLDQKCTVSSVGSGGLGQLGLGNTSDATTLTPISSLSDITAVVADGQHACAVTISGALLCWGEDTLGASVATPTQVPGISSVVQASLGTRHGIAFTASCQVFVWGKNTVGQLGLGNTTDAASPTSVTIN